MSCGEHFVIRPVDQCMTNLLLRFYTLPLSCSHFAGSWLSNAKTIVTSQASTIDATTAYLLDA